MAAALASIRRKRSLLVFAAAILITTGAVIAVLQIDDVFLTAPPGAFVAVPTDLVVCFAGLIAAALLLIWDIRFPFELSRGIRICIAVCFATIAAPFFTFVVPYYAQPYWPFVYHAAADPIGVGNDVGRGPCKSTDEAVAGTKGTVAVVRSTWCSGDWDGNLAYFVFVHPHGEANTHANLAFAYRAETLPGTREPQVFWADAELMIRDCKNVYKITERFPVKSGLRIRYGKECEQATPLAGEG